ncbi:MULTISPECIES: amidase family protein [Streptomyces]|uniref:amidase family protein n=1 Tax=Streptomyces TaxID=1883 RepID=UPI000E6842AD|nr:MULTISPECIES: amidase family protein [Streptomyces]MDX3066036.1 amidase family protein [Streptomyces sp. ND04-05B]MDX3519589.1 amidase family protein [Streptomyces scabiei]
MIFRRTLLVTSAALVATAAMATPSVARPRAGTQRRRRAALHLAPASRQIAALRDGTITSRDLLEQYLDHIGKTNAGLNAVVTLDAEGARAAADAADRHLARTGEVLGPLHGLPMTVKDALETKGLRTTCGSPDLKDHVPGKDADAVALLRDAGAVIIGKTNVPVLCQDIQTYNPLFGKTTNPFDRTKTAGGSSGGPAAAVAAGLSGLEVGSDLAGSLRLPAAYCGVYALRTSRGASPIVPIRGHIPRPPGWATSSDMVTLGPIARTADDLALLLDVLAAPAPADRTGWKIDLPSPAKKTLAEYRVGIWADDAYCHVDADTRALLDQVSALVRKARAHIDDSTRPVDFAESDRLFQRLMYATASAAATDAAFAADVEAAQKVPAVDPSGLYLHSRTMRHRDWCLADEARQKLRSKWADYFADHDILITPATPTAAVPDQSGTPLPQRYITVDGQKRSYYDQTSWLNLASPVGLPAVVLPAGTTDAGLPLSIQIIGPYLADRTVLAAAKELARLLPTPAVPPAVTV